MTSIYLKSFTTTRMLSSQTSTANCMSKSLCFQKCPRIIFWVAFYFVFLYSTEWSWITIVLHTVGMNTLTIMVNLWLCFSLPFCLPLLPHSSHSLALPAVASQDQAFIADRRRVGSINRNWTNYKADVPLYDDGRTLSGGGVSVVLSLSLRALVLCGFILYFLSPCLSSSLSFLWLCLDFSSLFHHNVFNQIPL